MKKIKKRKIRKTFYVLAAALVAFSWFLLISDIKTTWGEILSEQEPIAASDEGYSCKCSCEAEIAGASQQPVTAETAEEAGGDDGAPAEVVTEESSAEESGATEAAEPAVCQNLNLRLNEFVADPATGQEEFIELFNFSDQAIDLVGWAVADGSGKETPMAGEVLAGGFYVIEKPKGALNNSGDIIILSCADQIIDQVSYGNWDDGAVSDNAPVAVDPYSVAWDGSWQLTQEITKGAVNVIVSLPVAAGEEEAAPQLSESVDSPAEEMLAQEEGLSQALETEIIPEEIIYSDKIIISELLPNPVGADGESEFIELKNLDLTDVDLTGWQVGDASRKFTLAGVIGRGGFLVVGSRDSGISLNNSSPETVFLYNPAGQIVEQISYSDKAAEATSYSRGLDGAWSWTATPTPGQENILLVLEAGPQELAGLGAEENETVVEREAKVSAANKQPGQIISTTLEEVRNFNNGDQVRVSGLVAVEPGVLGSQIIYLKGSGIQVYFNKKDWPDLKTGDRVEVVGELSESSGERRIKVAFKDDIKIIGHEDTVEPLETSSIGEELEGYLVKVSGKVLESKSNKIWLDSGSGEILIYIKESTGIGNLSLAPGQKVEIIGIVSQSDDEYRLLPRYAGDILLEENQVEVLGAATVTPQPGPLWYLVAVAAALAVSLAYFVVSQKMKGRINNQIPIKSKIPNPNDPNPN